MGRQRHEVYIEPKGSAIRFPCDRAEVLSADTVSTEGDVMRNMSAFVSVGGLVGRSAFTGSRSASTCDVLGRLVIPLRVQCNRLIAPKMATQQETAWNPVKVVENSPAAEDHRYVVIEVGVTSAKGSLIDSYRTPGQYVQIRPPGGEKPGFFAISCAPNIQGFFEFLIKETEGSDWICKAKVGDVVRYPPSATPFALYRQISIPA